MRIILASTLAALALVPASGQSAPVSQTEDFQSRSAGTNCDLWHYRSRYRHVMAKRSATVMTARLYAYPRRTVIQQGQGMKTDWRADVSAGFSLSAGISTRADVSLGGIIKAYAQEHSAVLLASRVGVDPIRSTTIISDGPATVPGASSVVWFAGDQVFRGTFQYSSCVFKNHDDEMHGRVVWDSGTWWSYAVREEGAQRCDVKANSYVATAAQRLYCRR